MQSDLIRVRSTLPHMRGQRIAGANGVLYWVNPSTGLLHAVVGGNAHPEPGVDRESAGRFRRFAGFKVEKRPPPAPAPAPAKAVRAPAPAQPRVAQPVQPAAPPPASSGSEASSDLPDSDAAASGSLDASSEAPEPEAKVADQLPGDLNDWSIKRWIKGAGELGIALTDDEAATRPKADLVALIRDKAAELDGIE